MSRDPVLCAAGTCREAVRPNMLMCRAHWLALPCGLRCSILITFRHRLVRDYQALVSKAVDLIEGFERDPSVTRVSIDGVWTYYRGEVLS